MARHVPIVPPSPVVAVRLLNPRWQRWVGVAIPGLLLGVVGSAGAAGIWLHSLPGIVAGIGFFLGLAWLFDQWSTDPATATVAADGLHLTLTRTGQSQTLPFADVATCQYFSFKGQALRLTRHDGTRLRLRASADTTGFRALATELQTRLAAWQQHGGRRG